MPSRRVFKERILREVRSQQSGLTVDLTLSFSTLTAASPLAALDRIPILTAGGQARYVLGSTARNYVLGISGGTATIPENLSVQGNTTLGDAITDVTTVNGEFTHLGVLTYLAQGTSTDQRAIVGAGTGLFGAIMTIRAPDGYGAGYRFNNGTDLTTGLRWQVYKSGNTETGGASGRGGANYLIRSYDNSGANFREDLNISRSTGAWVTAGALTIAGALAGATTGAFSSNVTVGGTLAVTGNVTLTANLTVNGNTTLGDATSDTLTVTARMASGLTWATDNTLDIGASGANRPRRGYFGTELLSPTGTFTNIGGTLTTASQPNVTTMANLTTIGTLVAGAVPASLVTAGTFGAGAYTFPSSLTIGGAFSGATTGAFSSNVTIGGTLGVTGASTFNETVLLSGTVASNYALRINQTTTAVSGTVRGLWVTPTLTATANGDLLSGIALAPAASVGAFTGTEIRALNIGNVTGAATNYAIYTANGLVRFGDATTIQYAAGVDGLSPVTMLLRSTTVSSAWTAGSAFARYGFWSEDGSGVGNALRASLDAYNTSATGAAVGVRIQVSDITALLTAAEFDFQGIDFNTSLPITGGTYNGQTISSAASFTGTLGVTGAVTMASTLAVTGAISGSNLSGTNTGDQTITLTGDVTGSGTGTFAATIANDAVTYAKMQDTLAGNVVLTRAASGAGEIGETALGASELLGRGSTGNVAAITLGSGLTMSGTTLSATGGGTGDVVGPASATDNAVVRYDGTTGKLVQNSPVLIGDTGALAGVSSINMSGFLSVNTDAFYVDAASKRVGFGTAAPATTTAVDIRSAVVGAGAYAVFNAPSLTASANNATLASFVCGTNASIHSGGFSNVSWAGLWVLQPGTVTGTVGNRYGIRVGTIAGGTNSYAIETLLGFVKFGDSVSVGGAVATPDYTSALITPPSTVNRSSLQVRPGVAPSAPVDGDLWNDGTQLRFREAGANQYASWAQQSAIGDPSGGSVQDSEARTAIAAIIDALQAVNILA